MEVLVRVQVLVLMSTFNPDDPLDWDETISEEELDNREFIRDVLDSLLRREEELGEELADLELKVLPYLRRHCLPLRDTIHIMGIVRMELKGVEDAERILRERNNL